MLVKLLGYIPIIGGLVRWIAENLFDWIDPKYLKAADEGVFHGVIHIMPSRKLSDRQMKKGLRELVKLGLPKSDYDRALNVLLQKGQRFHCSVTQEVLNAIDERFMFRDLGFDQIMDVRHNGPHIRVPSRQGSSGTWELKGYLFNGLYGYVHSSADIEEIHIPETLQTYWGAQITFVLPNHSGRLPEGEDLAMFLRDWDRALKGEVVSKPEREPTAEDEVLDEDEDFGTEHEDDDYFDDHFDVDLEDRDVA